MMNKKAGAKYISPGIILLWIIIIVGTIIPVVAFYSAGVDVKSEEADFLAERIANCLIEDGYLREDFSGDFDLSEKCRLDEEFIDQGGFFYLDLSVTDLESGTSLGKIERGIRDFRMQCSYKKSEKTLASCQEKTLYALNQSDNSQKFLIKIFTGSNQLGKEL